MSLVLIGASGDFKLRETSCMCLVRLMMRQVIEQTQQQYAYITIIKHPVINLNHIFILIIGKICL